MAANLVLIVILPGYENFISKIDTGISEAGPDWIGKLAFLRYQYEAELLDRRNLGRFAVARPYAAHRDRYTVQCFWNPLACLILHLTIIFAGVMFAVMNRVAARSDKY